MSSPGRLDTREYYIPPPGAAREARPAWRDAVPFRIIALLMFALILYGFYELFFVLHIAGIGGGNAQG